MELIRNNKFKFSNHNDTLADIVHAIDEFNSVCADREHTDTGVAWEVLLDIRKKCCNATSTD